MNVNRRAEIAAAGFPLLDDLEEVVVDSWTDLLPIAATWRAPARARARAASAAALRGLLRAFEHGDLDDRTWDELRETFYASGHATVEEATDLLRSVRVAGVEQLADELTVRIGLTHEERWTLQREASSYCNQLLAGEDEPDPAAVEDLLRALERSGPDLR